jgi:transposase
VSTTLLYHAFGIQGYQHVRTEHEHGRTVFVIGQRPGELRCPKCGSWQVIRRGTFLRRFRSLPIGGRLVMIELPVQRVECRACGVVQQVQVRFADARRSYTVAFERYVLDLCHWMTIQDVACHLGISWDTVKDIHKRHLWRRFRNPSLKGLTYIAIDEICVGHGPRYLRLC